MQPTLRELLAERVLIFDGAMGTQIQAADPDDSAFCLDALDDPALIGAQARHPGLVHDGCNELLSFTRPDLIQQIHEAYFDAGSDIVETNTFGTTDIVLAEFGLDGLHLDYELCKRSAEIAKQAAAAKTDKPRFVCGALGPGTKLISLGQAQWEPMVATYERCALGLIDGGADAILLETLQDLLMIKAGLVAVRRALQARRSQIPIFIQVTLEQTGTMLVGSDLLAALNFCELFPEVVAFGMNCATGPIEMAPHVRRLAEHSTRPITIQPNAGLPIMQAGKTVYPLTPAQLAEHHVRFVEEFGVALAGGCCGTTPAHIQAVAEAVGGRPHMADCHWRRVQSLFPGLDFRIQTPEQGSARSLQGSSSLYEFVPFRQDNSYLIVGEKTNANGSKAFRDALAEERWDSLLEIAKELVDEGSHVLDVCTAYVGRDERRDMVEFCRRLNTQVATPIMIDSTEPPVIEAALQTLAGKAIINSINFEDGGDRAHEVLQLCQTYGAAVVALTIDEEGMAKTAERKLAIAERLLILTREYGLADEDLFIDFLTFTLGSGDEEFRTAGIETLAAIETFKQRHPQVQTILGVSNISFGLRPAARQVLNSAFLHQAREVGLTAAIVHFSKLLPQNKIDPEVWQIADDLVFDRRQFVAARD